MKKLKILVVISFTFLILIKAQANECILEGDSAFQINKYNQCMAMQIDNSRNRYQMEINFLNDELKKLRSENQFLKQKLSQIKENLKNLFLNL